MRRIEGKVISNKVILSDDTIHHLSVIRVKCAEKIEINDNGQIYSAVVNSINPIKIDIIEKIDINRELCSDVTVFMPLLKNGNFDLCLQKATELGVRRIIPYVSSRSVVRLDKVSFDKKMDRFKKILLNASLQSNRNQIPTLESLIKLKDISSFAFDLKLLAYENESLKSSLIPNDINIRNKKEIAIVIGCEGGFSEEEVEYLVGCGYQSISLGKRILRAETAVFYSLSVLSYLLEV